MRQTPAEREKALDEYRAKLERLPDDQLVREAEQFVWLSAYASNNPRSIYHPKCDLTHDEARRRGKPWLYQRGWNEAYRAAGHEPSESDLQAALASVDTHPKDGDALAAPPVSGAVGEAETP